MKTVRQIATALMIAVSSVAAGYDDDHNDDDEADTETFVLVHGAWQAPYVWDEVKSQLQKKGHTVIIAQLPAHGSDNTHPASTSIDSYRDAVLATFESRPEKVILVGHSMAGVVVSAVAEKRPDKIKKLVYIGAFAPANGQSLLSLSSSDAQSQLGPSLISSQDQLTLDIKRENLVHLFCADAPAAVQKKVLDNFKPEPAIPFTNAVALTDAKFGTVEKVYIHTTKDNVIGMDLQNRMATQIKVKTQYSLETSHCPFLSKPKEVTNLLVKIAR